jgi:hypothetical protein
MVPRATAQAPAGQLGLSKENLMSIATALSPFAYLAIAAVISVYVLSKWVAA